MGVDWFIVVDRVIKVYESRGEKVTALREVSLSIRRGEVVAIMGPSGSGKTTLLNIIAGVDKPTAGKVYVDGRDLTSLGERELEEYRLRTVGYVFQQFNLIPTLTAVENVLLPMTLAGRPDRARAMKLLEEVGLGDKANRYPEELSGGEQQRLAIAIALANDPPIIIADEPTGELDIATGERIVRILLDQSRIHGKTVVMTTHDPRVARMADRVVLLEYGRVRGAYEPRKIAAGLAGLGGAEGEVHAERLIVEYLKNMLESARAKKQQLATKLARGEIGLDELVTEYLKLRSLEEAIRDELARLGAGVEA